MINYFKIMILSYNSIFKNRVTVKNTNRPEFRKKLGDALGKTAKKNKITREINQPTLALVLSSFACDIALTRTSIKIDRVRVFGTGFSRWRC